VTTTAAGAAVVDLASTSLRELNQYLHHELPKTGDGTRVEIRNPNGMHNIAVGLDFPAEIDIRARSSLIRRSMNKSVPARVRRCGPG